MSNDSPVAAKCEEGEYCFHLLSPDPFCMRRPFVFLTCIAALMIGVYGYIKLKKNLKSSSSRLYSLLWISYGVMMSSAGLLHCIIRDSPVAGEPSFMKIARIVVLIVDVGLTSSIGAGFGVVGLIDVFNAPKLIALQFLHVAVIFALWTASVILKKSWYMYLYFVPIAIGCTLFMVCEAVLYLKWWRNRKAADELHTEQSALLVSPHYQQQYAWNVQQQQNLYPNSYYYSNIAAPMPHQQGYAMPPPMMLAPPAEVQSSPCTSSDAGKLPGFSWLLLGGLSGFFGVLFCVPLAKWWCAFLGDLNAWFGPEFMWFLLSDAAMWFLLFYVLRSDVMRKSTVVRAPMQA